MKPNLTLAAAAALVALDAWGVVAAPAAPSIAPTAEGPLTLAGPSVAVVKKFLAYRAGGNAEKMRAMLTLDDQKDFPQAKDYARALSSFESDETIKKSANVLALAALLLDTKDNSHFRYRVLGISSSDPATVYVRAYQVGQPLSSIVVLPVMTAQDSSVGSAFRIDVRKTSRRIDPVVNQATSASNLMQIGLGIIQYTQDNDEKLPDADKWVDEIMPYVKTETVFRDPAAPTGEKWSYAFNDAFSGKKIGELNAPANDVIVFESTLGVKNAHDNGQSIPKPGRHNGGTDYAFADGHVKWLPNSQPPSLSEGKG